MPKLTTRDYKRSSRASGAAKLREFGLGVVVGAVLASAAFLIAGAHARQHRAATASRGHAGADSQSTAPHAPAPDDTSSDSPDPAAPSGSPSSAQSASGHAKPPQYDFYRMLPSFRVPVTRDDGSGRAAPPPAASRPESVGSGPSYVLQVGSYRSTAEAEQVRGRLARAGITAQVQHIAAGSGTLNRVRIGPLSDAELARVREQLRTANIHALLIRADR